MKSYSDQRYLQKKKGSNSYRAIFWSVILLIAIFGIIYIIAYSPVFQIKNFTVSGLKNISQDSALEIVRSRLTASRLRNFFGSNNMFFWNADSVNVSKTQLASAVIKQDWLRQTVGLEISERERLAIWCSDILCYWIDNNGIAFSEAPETEGSLILKISVAGAEAVEIGSSVIEERFIKNLVAIIRGISELRLPIQIASYDGKLGEIRVNLYNGPDIYFSTRFGPALSIDSLSVLMEQKDFYIMNYVDLRVENRIFYKK